MSGVSRSNDSNFRRLLSCVLFYEQRSLGYRRPQWPHFQTVKKSEKSFKYLCASWLSFDFYEPLACVLLFSLHIPLTYVNNRWSHHRRLASLYQSLGLAVGEGSLNQFLTFSLFVVLIAEHIFYCNHWKFIGWLVNTLISTNGKIILGFQTLECLFWSLKCCY